ncbi:MAG: hypothetical protein F4Y63_06805 [Chloroflexi bacterium]|nr:hypothetical protein [Chloroflexota bacterium]MYK61597.1 hypothetical protein [Chloroflexota bacterium]
MEPPDAQTSDLEPPDGPINPSNATRRSAVKNVLSALNGWQAVPAFIIALYLFLGVFGPTLAPFNPEMSDLKHRFCPPLAIDALTTSISSASDCSATNVFGTDQIGRDIFSRLLHGARTSLWVVGLSVFTGTAVGSVVGAVVNGWRRKLRLVSYGVAIFTIVPFAVFVFAQPHSLYIYGVINSAVGSNAVDWSAVVALSSFSAVLTFVLVAVAYRYDEACRVSWVSEVDAADRASSFCEIHRRQIVALAPWIGLAAIANSALVFLGSGSQAYLLSAITWSFEWEYLLEHIGMFSALLPMVLFPIAFVTFGAWWFVRHVRDRFKTISEVSSGSEDKVDDGGEELAIDVSTPTDRCPDSVESGPLGNDVLIDSSSIAKRRRWIVVIIAITAAIAALRFGGAEVVPVVRELAQDSYQSASTVSRQGWVEASNCATEMSSRVMTFRALPPEEQEIKASQRCLELYFEHRNAPTHRLTIDYALQFVPQTLTLALIATVVSTAVWVVTSASANVVRRTITACLILVALLGLMLTFGSGVWTLVVLQWIDPVISVTHDKSMATSRALNIVRDFSVALGVTYLMIAILKPNLRLGKTVPKINVLSNWSSFFVPCILHTSGFLIVFHYHFPANFLFLDEHLGVIVNPSEEVYISSRSLVRYWIWTYWFALIGYAAIVLGFFAAGIWGFRRFVASDLYGVDSTLVSPDNPSQDADPT